MVATLSERLQAFFTGIKPGASILTRAKQSEILRAAKAVRSKDYIFNFDVPAAGGSSGEKIVTTTANWFFILTGAAVVNLDQTSEPKIKISMENFSPSSPLASTPADLNAVSSALVFAIESNAKEHFEEFKNLWEVLGQRVTISAECFAPGAYRGALVLTGLEFDLEGLQNG